MSTTDSLASPGDSLCKEAIVAKDALSKSNPRKIHASAAEPPPAEAGGSHPSMPMAGDLARVLVSEDEIQRRVRALGAQISRDYAGGGSLTIIAVINGALLFVSDLLREITVPVQVDCMRVSSYRNDTTPVQEPEIIDMLRLDLRGRHVLIIDDILDTGHTFERVTAEIRKLGPASLRFGVLLEKLGRREVSARPDYVGFSIPDEFVVGYGLDFAEDYRNLPCIGVLRADCQNPPEWA